MATSFLRFLDHTQRRITVGRTPLDEWSARRRYLYLTTHSPHNRQISIIPVEFKPTILAGERPQTYALDRAATGTCIQIHFNYCGDLAFLALPISVIICQKKAAYPSQTQTVTSLEHTQATKETKMETLHVIDQVFWLMIIRHTAKKLPTCTNSKDALLRQNVFLVDTNFNVPHPTHSLTPYCRESVKFAELQKGIHYLFASPAYELP
jgi:hypothetical protein